MLRSVRVHGFGAIGISEFESVKSRNKQSALKTQQASNVGNSSTGYDRNRDAGAGLDQARELPRNSRYRGRSCRITIEFSERAVVIKANHEARRARSISKQPARQRNRYASYPT